jgi:hypothetical protein
MYCLLVRNFGFDTTDAILTAFFKSHGVTTANVHVVTNKGYGFVYVAKNCDPDEVISLVDNKLLNGRPVKVVISKNMELMVTGGDDATALTSFASLCTRRMKKRVVEYKNANWFAELPKRHITALTILNVPAEDDGDNFVSVQFLVLPEGFRWPSFLDRKQNKACGRRVVLEKKCIRYTAINKEHTEPVLPHDDKSHEGQSEFGTEMGDDRCDEDPPMRLDVLRSYPADDVPRFAALRLLQKNSVQPADSGKEDDDWLADNLESIDGIRKTVVTKTITASPGGTDEDSEDDEDLDAESQSDKPDTAEIVPNPGFRSKPTYHPSVQIASTKPDEKGRRYLVWNSVGNVTCKTEDISNRIEVRFANKSKRSKQEIVNDSWGFVMAALAHEGAVFATPLPLQENDEPTTGSTIRYHAFSTGSERLFGANESFTVSLENNEAAVSLAVGTGWVAVATSRRFLRIFSCTGCQLGVHWLQGNVVCLCGYENLLAVVYNTMPMTGDEYHVSVDLFDVTPNISDFVRCVSTTVLPLSPGHQLNWMGFSVDSLQLFAEDTSGVFSMLTALGPGSNSWHWVPSLEIEKFKKSAGHKYWPVTIMENKLAYVLLSGENKPAIYPEPVITTQPLRIPLCEPREGREKTDEACDRIHQLMYRSYQISHCHYLEWELRSTDRSHDGRQLESIVASQDVYASELDKAVLKQFQEACRTQRIAVAIDLALKMRTQKALTLALTIADHFGRSHVAQKIQDIISLRSHHVAEDEENYGISSTPYEEVVGPPISAAPRLLSSGNGNLGLLSNENFSQQTHKKPAINPFGKAQQPPSQLKRVQATDLTDLQSPAKKPALSVSKLAQLLDRQYDIKFCFAGSVNRPFLKKHARTSLLEELCCNSRLW